MWSDSRLKLSQVEIEITVYVYLDIQMSIQVVRDVYFDKTLSQARTKNVNVAKGNET